MAEMGTIHNRTIMNEQRVDENCTNVEDAADSMLMNIEGIRTYSERSLSRKIRRENKRLPEIEETKVPTVVAEYLFHQQIRLLIDSRRLSKLQAAVLILHIKGWKMVEIAEKFNLPYSKVSRTLRTARRRLSSGSSPYDGLYEVYWSEVNRFVYRKPQSKNG